MGKANQGKAAQQNSASDGKGAKLRQACLNAADGDELVFIEGHDDAIIGVADVDGELRVVYGRAGIGRKLMARDGMDRQGAAEFVDYNIVGAFPGDNGPVLLCAIRPSRPR